MSRFVTAWTRSQNCKQGELKVIGARVHGSTLENGLVSRVRVRAGVAVKISLPSCVLRMRAGTIVALSPASQAYLLSQNS